MLRTYQPKSATENGARLQKENGDGQRQKGIEAQKSQRQTQAQLLSPLFRNGAKRGKRSRSGCEGPQSRTDAPALPGAKVTTMEKQKKPHV